MRGSEEECPDKTRLGSEQVSRFPGSTERDRAVGLIPRKQPGGLAAKVQPRTVNGKEVISGGRVQ